MTINTGWGDGDEGGEWAGGYGDHPSGWGHPPDVQITLGGGSERRDIGGEWVEVYGVDFPPGPYQVEVAGVVCYSGVQLQGTDIWPSDDLSKFSFVLPNLYGKLGPQAIVVRSATGTLVIDGLLTIVRYSPGTNWVTHALRYQSPGSAPVWYLPMPRARAGEV
jgi:hypothetical protein